MIPTVQGQGKGRASSHGVKRAERTLIHRDNDLALVSSRTPEQRPSVGVWTQMSKACYHPRGCNLYMGNNV